MCVKDINSIIGAKAIEYFKKISILELTQLLHSMEFTDDEKVDIFNEIILDRRSENHEL